MNYAKLVTGQEFVALRLPVGPVITVRNVSPSPKPMINFNNTTAHQVDESLFNQISESTKNILGFKGAIELTIVDDAAIRELNKKYAQNDYSTDVLSWAYQETSNLFEHELIGEVYISIETAMKQADEKNHPLEYELQYLFAHGLLHVLGYDHQDEGQQAQMEQLPDRIIQGISA